jgi:hypothetical protein
MSMEKSRLEELSKALPEKERKELLERIGRRMEQEESEDPVPVELQQDERDKIIIYELKKASAWVRFMLWLRTLVSGRSRSEVFLDIRLRSLKNHIRSKCPGITGFESRDLSVKFARKLYDLYLKVQAVAGIYHALASDKTVRGAVYAWYVEERWEHAKKGIDEFIRTEEMEEIFAQTGQTDEIKKKLSLRLNDYVHTIPESFLLQLEEEARLHLSLGRLVAFPYATFFRYFSFLLADAADSRAPSFEPAPVMLTLDLMEKLHITFGLFHHNAPDYLYAEEPISCYFAMRSGVKPGVEPVEKRDEELGKLRVDIMNIAHEIDDFEAAIPLLDLLRYYRQDPWFQLVFNTPRLYLRSMYFSTLKARLGQQLDERMDAVKEMVIGRKIQEVLKGQRMLEFSYYKENPDFDFRKLGLPYFSCIRSLTLVYNYLLQQFKGAVQEAAQLVASTVLANNRIMQSRLSQNISGLEDLEARIVLFDRALSPDEDDGKQLAKFRFNVATDLLLQKTYRAFIQQKDRDARDLIDKTRDFLTAIRKTFDEFRTSAFENTRSLLKTLHMYRGRNQTLGQILNARSESIGVFLKLLDQLLEMEKGS